MDASEAKQLTREALEQQPVDISAQILVIDNRIRVAATSGKKSIGMNWEELGSKVANLVFKHYESKGFRVCGADDASYIGWH